MRIATALWLVFAAVASAAGLEFKELTKEITPKSSETQVTADFEFTNTSSKPVAIAKTDPGCSCLKVEVSGGKLKYGPGESGSIRATFDIGNAAGTVDKMVMLWLDGDAAEKPSARLSIRVHIPVLITLEPKTLTWFLGEKPDPKTIHIHMAEGKTIHVSTAKSSSDAFATEVKEVERGRKYDLVITPKATASPGIGVIRIDTDCEIPKHKIQQAFAVVRKPSTGEVVAKP
jgi:hypothetical protein